ncbi:DUF3786 domain-containing protein [Thermodesulfobacteriota bacterium]
MPELKNAIDVLKLTDRSNCGECGLPTCLAFSAAVINGTKQLEDCPKLDEDTLSRYKGAVQERDSFERQSEQAMREMQEQIGSTDLEAAARRIGAPFEKSRLTIHCLGKKVSVDQQGGISTDIHVNPWIVGPLFNYILASEGVEPTGNWVPLRDLPGGKDWQAFFNQRCEKPCKKVADTNPDFFDDLISLFSGKKVENHYESDVSLVLYPLPKVPILICYWRADGDLPSDLNIFFDETAERNLIIDSIYTLGAGLVLMFEKIARNHGYELG